MTSPALQGGQEIPCRSEGRVARKHVLIPPSRSRPRTITRHLRPPWKLRPGGLGEEGGQEVNRGSRPARERSGGGGMGRGPGQCSCSPGSSGRCPAAPRGVVVCRGLDPLRAPEGIRGAVGSGPHARRLKGSSFPKGRGADPCAPRPTPRALPLRADPWKGLAGGAAAAPAAEPLPSSSEPQLSALQ